MLRFALTFAFALLTFALARSARAEACIPTRAVLDASAAVVRVDARGATSLGIVFRDPYTVIAPLDPFDRDPPGSPDAWVLDVDGRRVAARLVTTARGRRLAVLRTTEPLADRPFWAASVGDDACTFGVTGDASEGPAELTWSSQELRPNHTRSHPLLGAPIVDSAGALVAIVTTTEASWSGRTTATVSDLRDVLEESSPPAPRRSALHAHFVFDGVGQWTRGGGLWGGATYGGAVRWREVLEARLELTATFLLPSHQRDHECVEPPCVAGVRGTLTPSIGPRVHVGGMRDLPIVLSASFGVTGGAQVAYARDGASQLDVRAPNVFFAFTPGVGVGLGPAEIRARAFVGRGETRRDALITGELALGVAF